MNQQRRDEIAAMTAATEPGELVAALEEAMAEGERLDAEVAVRDRALRRAVHEYATGGDDIVEMWIAAARKVQ